jgi:hypothetical protein
VLAGNLSGEAQGEALTALRKGRFALIAELNMLNLTYLIISDNI